MCKKLVFIVVCCLFVFFTTGCKIILCAPHDQNVINEESTNDLKTSKDDFIIDEKNTSVNDLNGINNEFLNVNKEGVKNFTNKLLSAIKGDDDRKLFKDLVDEHGFFSISYFADGRDRNVVVHIAKEIIRSDLVLASDDNRAGITLNTLFSVYGVNDLGDELIIASEELSSISIFDWKLTNEDTVAKNLEDIIDTCKKITMINNEYILQVFVLNDSNYALAHGFVVLGPYPSFFGDWVFFEKVNSDYFIRAIIQMT
jgi:hypothetical protein